MSKKIKKQIESLRTELEQSNKNVGSNSYYWSRSMLRLLQIVESQNKEMKKMKETIEKQEAEINYYGAFLSPKL